MPRASSLWDIFCTVIDNYGDIGVTWRLARQLADEHAISVRLWVDDLSAFQHIWPTVDPHCDRQWVAGIEIRRWSHPLPDVEPGGIVIEALACNLPETYIHSMSKLTPAPIWLNLEYLSAENWVAGVHGLPSPHPRLPLTKYFFMPGYQPETGGLTRENGLLALRNEFQKNATEQSAFRTKIGLPPTSKSALRVSLFSYKSNSIASLLSAMAEDTLGCELLVPIGKSLPPIAQWFRDNRLQPGDTRSRGNLIIHVLPMLSQDQYEKLLWHCEVNFVRGEDSFVRGQFAGRPLIWQAYRQEEAAHLDKLDAFLGLYCASAPESAAKAVREFWHAWNREEEVGGLWRNFRESLSALNQHSRAWATHLAAQPDMASNLVKFINKLLESRAF
jgi:uncharacterized repeat protein (TIGR03837 family)